MTPCWQPMSLCSAAVFRAPGRPRLLLRPGRRWVLADKGFCGTSGVTATAGPGHWWVPPDPAGTRGCSRGTRGACGRAGGTPLDGPYPRRDLADTAEPRRALCLPAQRRGDVQYRNLRGPEYMKAMRRLVRKSGVRILDGSPALELLLHGDGSVAGARGIDRVTGTPWTIRTASGRPRHGRLRLHEPSAGMPHQHRRRRADGCRGRC